MTPPEPLRVLIATISLSSRTGTDTYSRDLALGLLRRGLLPVVYTTYLGALARELRAATIPVVDDVMQLNAAPDVIHGHHSLETLAAMARFPQVPALYVCHDALAWHSVPPRSRRIQQWVAVDRNCRDRMMFEYGVPEDAIEVLANAVDLRRFRRREPLPPRPRRALIFSNAAAEYTIVPPIRAACAARNIELDVVGEQFGTATWNPEQVLPRYDIVFGKARCALEAAATGAAVIVCDAGGLSGMMTADTVEAMRALNFGARTLQRPVSADTIGSEIDRYDPADARLVCERIRNSADIEVLVDQYVGLYERLVASGSRFTPEETLRDLASAISGVSWSLRTPQRVSRSPHVIRRLLNARVLSKPMRALHRLKKRLGL